MAEIAKAVAYIVKAVTMANNVFFVDSAEVDPQESPALLFSQKQMHLCPSERTYIYTGINIIHAAIQCQHKLWTHAQQNKSIYRQLQT